MEEEYIEDSFEIIMDADDDYEPDEAEEDHNESMEDEMGVYV